LQGGEEYGKKNLIGNLGEELGCRKVLILREDVVKETSIPRSNATQVLHKGGNSEKPTSSEVQDDEVPFLRCLSKKEKQGREGTSSVVKCQTR